MPLKNTPKKRPEAPAEAPPTPPEPPKTLVLPDQISTEDLLRVLRMMLGDQDALLLYDAQIVTKTGVLCSMKGSCSFSGLLTPKRLSTAATEVEDQLRLLVVTPMTAQMQDYTDAQMLAATREREQEEQLMFLPAPLPAVDKAAEIPEVASALVDPQDLSE